MPVEKSSPVPPDEFVCPLTKEMMSDPVMSRYGHHFERNAILKWLNDGNTHCPLTGNPLRLSNLISDKTLKWKIDYWAKKSGRKVIEVSDDDMSTFLSGGATIAVPDKRFICPLTKTIMDDPVMTKTGYNFERHALGKWLNDMGQICPVTKGPLRDSEIVSNAKLKWEISQWQLHYGDMATEISKLELETKLSKAVMVSKDYHISDILQALTGDMILKAEEGTEQEDEESKESADVLDILDEVVSHVEA
eukprot:scaffold5975_cov99-Cylindrotheca_fusiformis.AAC.5